MRLILNSMALLHAEMGRLHLSLDHDGTPLIERFERERFCTDVQLWCFQGRELGFDRLFDDLALCEFFHLGPEHRDEVRDWPLVRLYRGLMDPLRGWQRQYRQALGRLREGNQDAVSRLLADLERVFRATLDTASVRVDPWITGLAWRRLTKLRHEERTDALGLYGWVDRPYHGTPGPTPGGTLLAPSYAQLLTSVILRDKQIHDPQADRWKIDLDSRAVRPAKRFADEVRAGAHLQEVLGRAVEGIVAQPDRVQVLRDQFPIRSEHAGRRTCDGQAVLKDGLATLNAMALSPEQLAALAELRTVTNTYGDLLVADAVHHVVSGRPEKAGEAMEAAAGLELPPEFDVIRTPHSGHTVSTTVWFALPDVELPADTSQVGPAALADAAVAAYVEQRVPVDRWRWKVKRKTGSHVVTLADLGLSVADTLAYSQDGLRQLAIEHANGQSVIDRTVNGVPSSPGLRAHRELGRVAMLCQGHVRDDHEKELRQRLVLLMAAQQLSASLASDADASALGRARRWGIAPSPLDDALAPEEHRWSPEQQREDQRARAKGSIDRRLARATDSALSEAPAHQVAQAVAELAGTSMPVFGACAEDHDACADLAGDECTVLDPFEADPVTIREGFDDPGNVKRPHLGLTGLGAGEVVQVEGVAGAHVAPDVAIAQVYTRPLKLAVGVDERFRVLGRVRVGQPRVPVVAEAHREVQPLEPVGGAVSLGGELEEPGALGPLALGDRARPQHLLHRAVVRLEGSEGDLGRPAGVEGVGPGADGNVGIDERTATDTRALHHGHAREESEVNPALAALGMVVVPEPVIPRLAGEGGLVPAAPTLQHQNGVPGLSQATGGNRPPEAAADDNDIVPRKHIRRS
jgi:hypothetical protein